ncbi:Integrase catalytic region (plasmid) [Burkholderia sp. YI23]|nr:Integrase catalytic region [Burkholderia sp. YI23]
MKQRPRIYYSETQKALMWDRWRKGDTIHQIAKLFDRGHSSIQRILSETGGIQPVQRHRAPQALTLAEREEISRFLVSGLSIRSIGARLGRAPSTISRELQRNGGGQGYRASQADAIAWERARRPKVCKLVRNQTLARVVAAKLNLQWSPEQIAGWLRHAYAVNKDYLVSHETIYSEPLYSSSWCPEKELLEHLRRSRTMRRSRHHTLKTEGRTNIRDAVSISERPATPEDRAIPGHWEGDLLYGNATSQIATLVERQSRFVMLVKVASKDSEAVVDALIRHASKLPRELYKSLTWDRGSEMADHNRFTVATDIEVYFCDPQHPWQRGSNENTNGLLRQYFPKGTDLSAYSQTKLNAVARRLNERPRKTLNFDTPAERFNQIVASTG